MGDPKPRKSTGSFKYVTTYVGWKAQCRELAFFPGPGDVVCNFTAHGHTAYDVEKAIRDHIKETHREPRLIEAT